MLGATFEREHGGTSAVFNFQGAWLLLVSGGAPTKDKPEVTFAPPRQPDTVSHELTILLDSEVLPGFDHGVTAQAQIERKDL